MNVEIGKYALQLRRLVEEYYHQQMTMDDYRLQRKRILDQLEMELAADADTSAARRTPSLGPSTTPR